MRLLVSSIITLCLFACDEPAFRGDEINSVYESRDTLIKQFTNTDVWTRGGATYVLNIYNRDGKVNGYTFKKQNGLKLESKTREFSLNEIERFTDMDTVTEAKVVKELFSNMLKMMDSLSIREVTVSFSHLGITLKFNLKGGGVVFYVKDLKAVTIPSWLNYIKDSKKLDENWYFNEK